MGAYAQFTVTPAEVGAATVTVSLNAGGNTIRIDPTTAAGLPDIDHLDVGAAAA